jgi:hypothetical protein
MPRYSAARSGGSTTVLEPPATVAFATPATPVPTTPQGGRPQGLKKVSFGKIATKKEDTKTAYPVMPDADGKAGEIAARSRCCWLCRATATTRPTTNR